VLASGSSSLAAPPAGPAPPDTLNLILEELRQLRRSVELTALVQVKVQVAAERIKLREPQVRALADTGERGSEHLMTALLEVATHPLPTPTPMPGAVNQDECSHTTALSFIDRATSTRRPDEALPALRWGPTDNCYEPAGRRTGTADRASGTHAPRIIRLECTRRSGRSQEYWG